MSAAQPCADAAIQVQEQLHPMPLQQLDMPFALLVVASPFPTCSRLTPNTLSLYRTPATVLATITSTDLRPLVSRSCSPARYTNACRTQQHHKHESDAVLVAIACFSTQPTCLHTQHICWASTAVIQLAQCTLLFSSKTHLADPKRTLELLPTLNPHQHTPTSCAFACCWP